MMEADTVPTLDPTRMKPVRRPRHHCGAGQAQASAFCSWHDLRQARSDPDDIPTDRSVARAMSSALLALKLFGVALLLAWLTGCASGPKQVVHTFSFDGWFDDWAESVDLLEFKYGDQYRMVQRKNDNGVGYSFGVYAPMPVAEFLYVRWRLKATGEVLEDRVDLRGRLPPDMHGHEVTFVIDGRQLYVYDVTPIEIPVELPKRPLKTYLSRYTVTHEVYPTNQLGK